jgi:hypothetical protein
MGISLCVFADGAAGWEDPSGTLQVRNVKMRFRDVIAGLDVGLDVYDLMGLVTVQAQGVKKSLRLVH